VPKKYELKDFFRERNFTMEVQARYCLHGERENSDESELTSAKSCDW